MKRVLTALVLLPVVLLLVFRAPLWLFAVVVGAVAILALDEYLRLVTATGVKPFRRLSYATALWLVYCFWLTAHAAGTGAMERAAASMPCWLLPLIFGVPLVFRRDLKGGLGATAASSLGVIYIAGTLGLLIVLRGDPFRRFLVVFTLFSVWCGDIAAYYVGRRFGRHKLAPVVSPKKSWEGALASVAGSIAVAVLFFHFRGWVDSLFAGPKLLDADWLSPLRVHSFPHISSIHVVALGTIANVAAQLGDLFESALKRDAGIKDSGSLLPGHGGILDRIDALLFAVPAVWYYANLTGLFFPR